MLSSRRSYVRSDLIPQPRDILRPPRSRSGLSGRNKFPADYERHRAQEAAPDLQEAGGAEASGEVPGNDERPVGGQASQGKEDPHREGDQGGDRACENSYGIGRICDSIERHCDNRRPESVPGRFAAMRLDIRRPLKSLLPHIRKAVEDNLNEADTRQRISRLLEEVLGYDPMIEITRETQIRGKYVDIAVKIDGNIKFLVEAKSAGRKLRDRYIDQAQHYAAEGNIPWVVLTNGAVWNLYHLNFDEGVEYTRVFSVDLCQDDLDKAAELRASFTVAPSRGDISRITGKNASALSPASIGRALFTSDTLSVVRREIRRHEGILIDEEDLARALHNMFSTEAREEIGPPRIRASHRTRRKHPARESTQNPATGAAPANSNLASITRSHNPSICAATRRAGLLRFRKSPPLTSSPLHALVVPCSRPSAPPRR